MPSALMPPWQPGMLSSLLSTIAQADAYVSSENELFLLDRIAVDDGSDGIARFEWITGRHAVRAVSSIDSYIYSDSLAYIDSNFFLQLFLTRWLEFSELFQCHSLRLEKFVL
mgnify:CR=1 FL=1